MSAEQKVVSSVSVAAEPWVRFDFNNPPPDGLYWVHVLHDEYDVDADDEGRTVGSPAGEVVDVVAMVYMESGVDEDGRPDVTLEEINLNGSLSSLESWDVPSHYIPVNQPSPPAQY